MLRYQAASSHLDYWLVEHPLADDKYFMLKQQLEDTDSKLDLLINNDKCSSCNQIITEKHKKKERKRLEGLKGVIITTIIEYEIWRDRIQKVTDKLDDMTAKVEGIRFKLTKYDSVPDKIKEKEKELKTIREESENEDSMTQQWRSKIKKLSKKITSYKRRIKEVSEEQIYLEEVMKGFSKTGIPNVIISRALRFLEERSNIYLDMLTNGAIGIRLSGFTTTKKGAVRNKIDIEVVSASGIVAYEAYSGGERQRLNISMLLALRDVAQTNKGIDLNCLWLDEVLDLSLDSAGISDVTMLLQHKKKDIDSVFIISPKDELIRNLSGNFDNLLRVYKENGFSKIVGG